ncbi:MAG: hypothetical protein WCD80_10280 [Desulfobaccales bacterium]
MKRSLQASLAALVLVLCMVLSPALVNATVTLTDLNSTVTINPDSQSGASSWTVGGVNQLYQQWFWYRLGPTGGESSIDTISAATVNQTTRIADISYANDLLALQITYTLTGGTTGSGTSDLAETIRITNNSSTSLDLHFFQYSDFDLGGSPGGDTVQISAAHNTVDQTKDASTLSETIVGPTPNHWAVGTFPATLNTLNSGNPTTLDDSVGPLGPTDATWAFEWDQTIDPGGAFIISKDKRIAPIPLPPSALLLGSGLVGLVGFGIRRRQG